MMIAVPGEGAGGGGFRETRDQRNSASARTLHYQQQALQAQYGRAASSARTHFRRARLATFVYSCESRLGHGMEWLKSKACGYGSGGGARDEEAAGSGPVLETAKERRERWRSVYVIYFTMFQMSLGFSIVLTGVWPYLDKVRCSM